jgi:trans-L-3-hydroxyproline dehydratase
VFADGEVDRSPTSGVSGMAALLHADGQLAGESVVIESITGSQFRVELRPTTFGPYAAVIPFVEGQAFISGQHLDPADPFPQGFFR